jgi:ABC-type phosphate transport system substrate-binding protein
VEIAIRRLLAFAVVALLGLPGTLGCEEPASFKVVVNVAVPGGSIQRARLSELFLKKVNRWGNGDPVAPVDQSVTSPIRVSFTRTVHGGSVSSIQSFWQQQISSGRDRPPPVKLSDARVIAFVGATRGGIGYVSESAELPAGVKSLKVVQ